MNIIEVGQEIASKRKIMGLSQERLGKLSGLSRSTINQLEQGTISDIGLKKISIVLDLLGINLKMQNSHGRLDALQMAAHSASVSYKSTLKVDELIDFFSTGTIQDKLLPYVATLIDEIPLALLCSCVEQVAELKKINPKLIWKNIYTAAHKIKSPRSDLYA